MDNKYYKCLAVNDPSFIMGIENLDQLQITLSDPF
jgi:hypothetical protein